MKSNEQALAELTEIEGYDDVMEMIQEHHIESVVPAICVNDDCDYSDGMEPDQDKGWCANCGTNTVKSCLILMGVI